MKDEWGHTIAFPGTLRWWYRKIEGRCPACGTWLHPLCEPKSAKEAPCPKK
jgi:hypothetical protein